MGSGVRFMREVLSEEGAKVEEAPSYRTSQAPGLSEGLTGLTVSRLTCPRNPLWWWAIWGLAIHEIFFGNPNQGLNGRRGISKRSTWREG